jgi:hypothetical protein
MGTAVLVGATASLVWDAVVTSVRGLDGMAMELLAGTFVGVLDGTGVAVSVGIAGAVGVAGWSSSAPR